jgi:hypothetical protein
LLLALKYLLRSIGEHLGGIQNIKGEELLPTKRRNTLPLTCRKGLGKLLLNCFKGYGTMKVGYRQLHLRRTLR